MYYTPGYDVSYDMSDYWEYRPMGQDPVERIYCGITTDSSYSSSSTFVVDHAAIIL